MKKLISIALIGTFVFSANLNAFAQKRKVSPGTAIKVDRGNFVAFKDIGAFTDGSGVLLQWQTTSEKGNFGFYIYRIDTTGKVLASSR